MFDDATGVADIFSCLKGQVTFVSYLSYIPLIKGDKLFDND